MFYRRKLILALIQVFGGKLEKINLQKLLFLLCSRQQVPDYEFVPYKYGCYSHSAKADLVTMSKRDILWKDQTSYHKKDKKDYLSILKDADRLLVNQIYLQFHKMDGQDLMRYTYEHFPYYAINSSVAENLLTKEQLEKIASERPHLEGHILYTIGYEGISLEAYLNKLIKNDVRVLVDVRNNPLSQKFGFSKSLLIRFCASLNIEYVHYPEVGIQSAFRQELKTQTDYDNLFKGYKDQTLTRTISTQQKILDLLIEKQRIALTCFEANIHQCHRKHLAESISHLPEWQYELKHI
jgi:uncharacterized protein (DUF488 family)